MKVLQIMVNEAKGTVTGIGPDRTKKQVFKKFGTVIYDDQQIKKFQPASPSDVLDQPSLSKNMYSDLYLLPAVCTSEHIGNWSIMGARLVRDEHDEHEDPVGQTFFKINIDTGELKRYCKPIEQDPSCETGVIDPNIPYAALYNREPRIPLSL